MVRLLSVLAGLVNAGLLALVALGLGGLYLHPGLFWWTAVGAVLLPYAVSLLILVALITLASRQWGWTLANALVALLALVHFIPTERFTSALEPSEDDLVVMTFSVPRFGETAEGLAQDVHDLLAGERPDIVALQKAAAWWHVDEPEAPQIADYIRPAIDSLGYELAIPNRLADRRTSLPILTRGEGGPIVLDQQEGTLGTDANAGRFVRTRMRWRNRDAVLYNVHLRGYGAEKPWEDDSFPLLRPNDWLPFIRRYREAFRLRVDEVRTLRERIDREDLPVIVAGDLNVTSRNWEYRQLARDHVDVFRTVGRGWGGTYRGDLPLVRIDYVLSDTAFTAVKGHVPRVQFSDHRPVVARLRWRFEDSEMTAPR